MTELYSESWDDLHEHIKKAHGLYGAPTSSHESLGVLLEEFDELRQAIHANKRESIREEAIDIAAAAMRLALAIERAELAFLHRSGL